MGGALTLPPVPPLVSGARIWVGFSGGCDSTVLLDLLRRADVPGLRAVHVHHGLQAVADDWARHCRRVCRRWGVPLRVLRVHVIEDGHGPEAAARAARRAAIADLLRAGDLYVTAHHRDDQAETVLQRALRGTGIPGLGAMRELEAFGTAQLWRPLLDIPQRRLREYADATGLDWIEDPHNRELQYARVFLRRQVMPVLAAHFPDAAARLAQLAAHARDAESLLAALARIDAMALGEGGGYDIAGLLALAPERRRNLLYHAWRALGLASPQVDWYRRIEREVLRARAGAEPLLGHGDGEARRHRGRLYLMRRLPPPPESAAVLAWPRRRQLTLPPGCGELRASCAPPVGTEVRFGLHGVRLQPAGASRRRALGRLWQDAGVPVWVRLRTPLIFLDGEVLAAGNDWRTQRCIDLGLRFEWVHRLPGGSY
jgi:tRNA(Ile)-lysidine synthase